MQGQPYAPATSGQWEIERQDLAEPTVGPTESNSYISEQDFFPGTDYDLSVTSKAPVV